eukprot:XP_001689795.1 artemis-related DNA-crosslink repair exonuclease [Chlamydomonas reinhardtii]
MSVDVYCTDLTRRLLLLRCPGAQQAGPHNAGQGNRFHTLELGVRTKVSYGGTTFDVTALDANHCPGSAMFLFQGAFGNILHTGDCRFTDDVVRSVRQALGRSHEHGWGGEGGGGVGPVAGGAGAVASGAAAAPLDCTIDADGGEAGGDSGGGGGGDQERLDLVYLDCTFADLPLDFPTREDAVRQAGQLIRRWAATTTNAAAAASSSGPRPHVYLAADMLGQEPLLALVGAEFGQPVYVPPPERHREYGFDNADLLRERRDALAALRRHPDLAAALTLSDDPACLFHLCGAFAQQVRAQYSKQGQMLTVRAAHPAPTAAIQERSVHYVLFSQHSSRGELAAALEALRPRAVRPINQDQIGCMAAVVAERAGPDPPERVEAEIEARLRWAAEAAVAAAPGRSAGRAAADADSWDWDEEEEEAEHVNEGPTARLRAQGCRCCAGDGAELPAPPAAAAADELARSPPPRVATLSGLMWTARAATDRAGASAAEGAAGQGDCGPEQQPTPQRRQACGWDLCAQGPGSAEDLRDASAVADQEQVPPCSKRDWAATAMETATGDCSGLIAPLRSEQHGGRCSSDMRGGKRPRLPPVTAAGSGVAAGAAAANPTASFYLAGLLASSSDEDE